MVDSRTSSIVSMTTFSSTVNYTKNGKKLFCRLCQLPDNVIRYLLLIELLIKNYVYAVYSCREMRQVYNNLL